MMYYYGTPDYLLFMLISIIITAIAQIKVKSAFAKYSKISNAKNLTGEEVAREILSSNNITDIQVNKTHGEFTDFFDSSRKGVYLSDTVHSKATVASASVAAHECGHAIQNAEGYLPLKIRQTLVPITQISSKMATPLIFIGLLLPTRYQFLVNAGIMLFSLAVFFQLVTLPVEFNASKRALKSMQENNLLQDYEIVGAKKVLSAAALTYVASLLTSLLSLLRLILIANSRRRD